MYFFLQPSSRCSIEKKVEIFHASGDLHEHNTCPLCEDEHPHYNNQPQSGPTRLHSSVKLLWKIHHSEISGSSSNNAAGLRQLYHSSWFSHQYSADDISLPASLSHKHTTRTRMHYRSCVWVGVCVRVGLCACAFSVFSMYLIPFWLSVYKCTRHLWYLFYIS